VPAVRELFKSVDWIGVSAYAGLPRFPSVADLETSLKLVDQEMKMFGMDLKGLGKEIIYSEYGQYPACDQAAAVHAALTCRWSS
jgi:hypothetical protein